MDIPKATTNTTRKIKEIYLVIFSMGLLTYLNVFENFSFTQSFILGYQLYLILRFINNVGYTICFFDFLSPNLFTSNTITGNKKAFGNGCYLLSLRL